MKKLITLFVILTALSFGETEIWNRLNGGEMSPLMKTRTDFDKYYSGFQTCENFIVMPQGGVTRRPGTWYIGTTKDNGQARIVSFTVSTTEAYILEFGDSYLRFWKPGSGLGGQVESGGAPYELSTVYGGADLSKIRFIQSNDVMYLVSPDHPIYKLSHYDEAEWTIEAVDWVHRPYRPANTTIQQMKATFYPAGVSQWVTATDYDFGDMVYIEGEDDPNDRFFLSCILDHTSTGNEPVQDDFDDTSPPTDDNSISVANTYWLCYSFLDESESKYFYADHIERGAPVELTTDTGTPFVAGMIGSYFELSHSPTATVFEYEDDDADTADGLYTSGAFRVKGDWVATTGGIWSGLTTIQRSYNFGINWNDVRKMKSPDTASNQKNFAVSGTEDLDDAFYRITYDCDKDNSNFVIEFNVSGNLMDGEVRLTSLAEGGGTIPDGSSLSSYTDILAHYKMNDNSSTWVDGSSLGSYGGCIAHYKCDDATTSSQVTDSKAGTLYHGTLYSASAEGYTDTVDDLVNYKVTDGIPASFNLEITTTTNSIECPAALTTALGTGDRTVALWVMPESLYNTGTLFNFDNGTGSHVVTLHLPADGLIDLYVNGSYDTDTGNKIEVGKWSLVVYTYDESEGLHEIFINGQRTLQHTEAVTDFDTSRLMIGRKWTGATSKTCAIDANIDNILIYSDILTSAEIAELYSGGKVDDVSGNTYDAFLCDDSDTGDTADVYDAVTFKVDAAGDSKSAHYDNAAGDWNTRLPASLMDAMGSGPRTFSAWVYIDDLPTTGERYTIFSFNNETSDADKAWVGIDETYGNKLRYYKENTGTTGTTTLEEDTWYLVTMTYSQTSGNVEVFLNTNIEISNSTIYGTFDSSDRVQIGMEFDTYTESDFFDGHIDNLLIYNRALNNLEVLNLYTTTATAYGIVEFPVYDAYTTWEDTSPPADTRNSDGSCDYTDLWSESSWSDYRGYPTCGTFFEQRFVVAATKSNRQTIWMSKTDDFENFKAGILDDDSLHVTLSTEQNNDIVWMASQRKLTIGTQGSEFAMGAISLDDAVSPTNIQVKRQSSYGSQNVNAIVLNDTTLYLQRHGKKLREFVYDFEKDGYVAPDLTILAEHITGQGIIELAYGQTPNTILWGVRKDGILVGLTYERSHDVVAWHQHILGGTSRGLSNTEGVQSVAVAPGKWEDEVWMIVKRVINGTTTMFIERMMIKNPDNYYPFYGINDVDTNSNFWTTMSERMETLNWRYESEPYYNNYFVDCGSRVEQGREMNVAAANAPDWLEGENVACVGFGGKVGFAGTEANSIVTGGSWGSNTEDIWSEGAYAGLTYTSKLRTMPLNFNGQLQGRTKRISSITTRFFRSQACSIGSSWTDYEDIDFTIESTTGHIDPVPEWEWTDTASATVWSAYDYETGGTYTGDYELLFDGDYETEGTVYIQCTLPLPLTITAIMPEFETYY